MYPIASSTADVNTLASNLGIEIVLAISLVLVAYASLLGLGFALRHIKKYVTGHKF